MALYYPVAVCRSDGLLKTVSKAGIEEPNRPTTAQLNNTPDADGKVDCYEELEESSNKATEWRRKLGCMLMHLLDAKKEHANRNHILKAFPEGYVLWEHKKFNVNPQDKATGEKKREKGKHAAGSFERQDAYLYGHPQGRKKRFRSPADFFPHLLWLAVDKDGDPRNCSCKICSPDGDEGVFEDPNNKIAEPRVNEIKDFQQPTIPRPVTTVAATPPPILPPAPAVSSKPAQVVPKAALQTASQVAVRSNEQKFDSLATAKYIYRPGELVWFDNEPNWRLGVISKRGLVNDKPRYMIYPLSNPLQHQAYKIMGDESQLRPWLAWSVPDTTIQSLKEMHYDQVAWDLVVSGKFDENRLVDYVVDGSILAAKSIDASYSLFERIENALAGPGEVHYNGMFLGAEKIWVGEPVRLKVTTNDIVVLIIHKLIERITPQGASSVTFVGDVWKLVSMPTPYQNKSEWPEPPNLPPRMVADLQFRNDVAYRAGTWYEWCMLEPAARKGLADIKGRWYESRTLVPILSGLPKYQDDISKGRTLDSGEFMNGRRDNNNIPERRKKNRRDTLGKAVSDDCKISRGLNGHAADNAFPDEQPQQQQQEQQQQLKFEEGDLDQYMNIDGPSGHDYYSSEMQH